MRLEEMRIGTVDSWGGKGRDGGSKRGMKEKEGISGMRVKSRKVLGLSSSRAE